MKKHLLLFAVLAFAACTSQETKAAQNNIEFDPSVYYSQLIINSNLYHFHCNTGKVGGLGQYDPSTGTVSTGEYVGSRGFDYVNGLVFKATLEAIQQHYNTEGLREDAYSWYKSVEEFGNRYYADARNGKSLDDLNACKLYFGLYDITKSGGLGLVDGRNYENSTTASHCQTAKVNALAGLNTHNSSYAISSAISNAFSGDESYTGGWFHKDTYKNQLWLDGQYMGPALLAMMIADGRYISASSLTCAGIDCGIATRSCCTTLFRQIQQTHKITRMQNIGQTKPVHMPPIHIMAHRRNSGDVQPVGISSHW